MPYHGAADGDALQPPRFGGVLGVEEVAQDQVDEGGDEQQDQRRVLHRLPHQLQQAGHRRRLDVVDAEGLAPLLEVRAADAVVAVGGEQLEQLVHGDAGIAQRAAVREARLDDLLQ